jgi:hypothetical protein
VDKKEVEKMIDDGLGCDEHCQEHFEKGKLQGAKEEQEKLMSMRGKPRTILLDETIECVKQDAFYAGKQARDAELAEQHPEWSNCPDHELPRLYCQICKNRGLSLAKQAGREEVQQRKLTCCCILDTKTQKYSVCEFHKALAEEAKQAGREEATKSKCLACPNKVSDGTFGLCFRCAESTKLRIVQLEKEIDIQKHELELEHEANKTYIKENTRLREALEEIEPLVRHIMDGEHPELVLDYLRQIHSHLRKGLSGARECELRPGFAVPDKNGEIAKQALGKKADKTKPKECKHNFRGGDICPFCGYDQRKKVEVKP